MEKYDWVDSEDSDHSLTVCGSRLLVRKCLRNDEDFIVGDPDAEITEEARLVIDSMMASERITPNQGHGVRGTNWCHVLAVGPDVGTTKSLESMQKYREGRKSDKKYNVPWGVGLPVSVGDYVVLPETSGYGEMWREVTGSKSDIIVDINEIVAWMRDDDELPTPVGDRVLVQPDVDTQDRSGIAIPDVGVERATTGTVAKLGTGAINRNGEPVEFAMKCGNSVLFHRAVGIDAQFNGKSYNILKQDDIEAVLA